MWKIKRTTNHYTYKFTHVFVRDLLNWANDNRGLKEIKDIEETKMTIKLKLLVKNISSKKLKTHMLAMSNCKKISKVRAVYFFFTKHYSKILKGEIRSYPKLDKETIKDIKPVFTYFYDHLLDDERFWQAYNPNVPPMTKLAYRKLETGYKTCPYCDQQHIFASERTNLDHFLPISSFPFIGVYWENLIISCSSCNGLQLKRNNWKIPTLNPFYDEPDKVLQFLFDYKKKEVRIRAKNKVKGIKKPSLRGHNFSAILKLNRLYNGSWFIVEEEKEEVINTIKNNFYRIRSTSTIAQDNEIISDGIK
ncbi:hypothetical protein V7Y60_26405, partial [Priestia megaterium]